MKIQNSKPLNVLCAALCILIGATTSLLATDITWTNAIGGDWSVAANWNPHQVPGPSDTAILPLYVIVTVNTDVTVSNIDLSNSTLGGSATLTVNGTLNWTTGTINGGGTTVIASGATFAISGANAKAIGPRTIQNNGTVTLTGGNVSALSYGTTFNNNSNGVVDFQGDASLAAPYGGTNILNNAGTVKKSGGTGTSTLGFTLNSEGSVVAQSGTLSLSGSGDSHGSFDTQPGAKLDFSGNTITLESNATVNAAAGTVSFSGTSAHVEVYGNYIAGDTLVNGGTANFNGQATTTNATLTSTLGGGGTFTVNGTMTWTTGTMNGSGTTVISHGATLAISGSNFKYIGPRTIENRGLVTLTNGNVLVLSYGATFDNATNGVLDFLGDTSLLSPYGGTAIFNNSGTVQKSGGSGTSTLGLTFNNDGTLIAQSGTLSLSGSGDSHGSFETQSGTTLNFGGNPITLESNATVSAAGTVSFGGFLVNINGSYSASNTLVSAGTANFNGTAVTDDGAITGGTLGGSGTFTVNGTMAWTSGRMDGAGTTMIANGGTLAASGSNTKDSGSRTIENHGTTTLSGGTLRVLNGAVVVFDNSTNGLLDIQGDVSFLSPFGGTGTINNAGTLQKSGGTGVSTIALILENRGLLDVQSGTIQMTGSLFSNETNGVVQGVGTLDVSQTTFTTYGRFNPGDPLGALTVKGTLPQTTNGVISIELGGTNAGVNFDQLLVTGNATLNGALNISLANAFQPVGGDTFEIMKYASHTGFFDSISGLNLGGGFYLEPAFTTTNLILTTVDTRPRPVFSVSKTLPNGALQFSLTRVAGQTFEIEASTNFVFWEPILGVTNSGAVYDFIVTDFPNYPYRFYRASEQ